jgi:cell division protein FtsL
VTAPSRAPARSRAPRRAPDGRPALRVVPPNTLSRHGRQRRARRFGALLSGIVVVVVFGVVAAHVMLTQRQFRLEALERKAAAEEARYERLRLQVAELESPERVVAAARQLGMVPPATVTYLASSRPSQAPNDEAAAAPGGEWANVKSHLAAARP